MAQDKEPLLSTSIDLPSSSSSSFDHLTAPSSSSSSHRSPAIVINSRTPGASHGRYSMSQDGNFVRVIERNVEYLKGQFEEVFASRSSQSLFVPVICGLIFFLYIINTIAWHMNTSAAAAAKHREPGDDPLAALSGGGLADQRQQSNLEDEDPAFEPNLPQLVKLLSVSPGSLLIPYNW